MEARGKMQANQLGILENIKGRGSESLNKGLSRGNEGEASGWGFSCK